MLSQQRVVIIGGGFAGVNLANKLANKKDFHVTLVDKNNYNFFPPLLYQVATAFLEVSSISYPFRKLFQNKHIHFRLGELLEVVPEEDKVILSNGELYYDHLVIATGAETNYFGNENIRKNALPMKTIDDALDIRNYLLLTLEQAAIAETEAEKLKFANIVIAGGGPTGVEIAGMLAEMKHRLIKREYPEMAGNEVTVHLVSGAPELLSPMSVQSQKDTYDALLQLGVTIRLHTNVKDYADDIVLLDTGETIYTKLLIWAAGVSPKLIPGMPEGSYGRGNRLVADAYNKIKGTANIYALGDACLQTTDPKFPKGHPQVAQVAIQQGKTLARNLIAQTGKSNYTPFFYFDKGSMAIIGKNKAVLDFPKPKIHISGFIAFISWLFVHLLYLVNYRNRFRTLFSWMSGYLMQDHSFRMIIRPSAKIITRQQKTVEEEMIY